MMIDVSVNHQLTEPLKEDVGHFRNMCQHTHMELVENVLKHLKNKIVAMIESLEQSVGEDKLKEILCKEKSFENVLTLDLSEA